MVYKDCDIGSAKPDINILKKYPHHLIDMVSPNQIFTVAEFCKFSKQIVKEIHNKGSGLNQRTEFFKIDSAVTTYISITEDFSA